MSEENKKSKGKELFDSLAYQKKSLFETLDEGGVKEVFDYAEGYKCYLDAAKTERDAVAASIAIAQKHGFTEYKLGDKLSVGDKKYFNNRNKSLVLLKIGKNDVKEDGVRILASHIDSPRLDIKQNPLYERDGMAFLKTHYYGGIKKYQWTAIPLALHGVVVLSDGREVSVNVGENDGDPIFYVNDLLPHLSKEQNTKPLATAIEGELLNVLVGGMPFADDDVKEKIKLTVLKNLNDRYGMVESDFLSAELAAVPAMKARDVGFDRSMIAAYGHDDKVCSYPALTAIAECETDDRTVMVVLADKEEIGSEGNTGMQCAVYADILDEIAKNAGANPAAVRAASKCLSADVIACYDPNFGGVFESEKRNNGELGRGTAICKFTGSGGKGGSNDASAEFVGYVRRLLDENGVNWQTAELGKVDAGGGGTVAKFIAKLNIDTIDIGVPVISMHAPYELISKADLFSTYKAFAAFVK